MIPPIQSGEWIEKLIGFDTVSSKSNLSLIELLRDHLEQFGLVTRLTFDDSESKANLFATIPGARHGLRGGIVFSGHTDVVPVAGQDWTSDPFVPDIRNERIYGRGACDMKGFLGVILAAIPFFVGMKANRPIHLAFSYDEELGCLGAPSMIADIAAAGLNPDACIVGEPTGMVPVVAHKGLHQYRCHVHGRSAHSSRTHEGVNAIEYAAAIILELKRLVAANAANGRDASDFDIPFTTANVGLIQGGTASNIVAEHCEFIFDCRPMPGFDIEALEHQLSSYIETELIPLMRKVDPATTIKIEKLLNVPSLSDQSNAGLVDRVMSITGVNRAGKVAFATEAGQFSSAGIPTIVCGPGYIEQAHRPDEYVSLEQVRLCENFVREIAAAYAN